jgi:cytochrome c2
VPLIGKLTFSSINKTSTWDETSASEYIRVATVHIPGQTMGLAVADFPWSAPEQARLVQHWH